MRTRAQQKGPDGTAENAVAGRRRKRRSSTTPDEEAEEVVVTQTTVIEEEGENVEVVQLSRAKRVRFSRERSSGELEGTPANGALLSLPQTPLSPPLSENIPRVASSARKVHRISLPHSSEQAAGTLPIIDELQFAPIRQVLRERIRRRLRRSRLSQEFPDAANENKNGLLTRHDLETWKKAAVQREERIKDLMLDLELQRQLGVEVGGEGESGDGRVRIMEAELAKLKEEVVQAHGEARLQHLEEAVTDAMDNDLNVAEDIEEGILVIEKNGEVVNHEDVFRSSLLSDHGRALLTPELPEVATATAFQAETEIDTEREAEILRFEQALAEKIRELAEARAALQIINIELKGLGFPGSSAEDILASIRTKFRQARLDVERLLPGETSTGFDNEELLNVLVGHIRDLVERYHESTRKIEAYVTSESTLRIRFNTALEELQEETTRRQNLERQWQELDEELDQKEKVNIELKKAASELELSVQADDQHIALLETEGEKNRATIIVLNERVHILESENGNHVKSMEKLQAALQKYRDDLRKLEVLIVKMEQDHKIDIIRKQEELEETTITMQERVDAERNQRQAAETELDQKTVLVADLHKKLSEAGIHANELRQRIYELQVQHAEEVKKLEDEAAAREEQFQNGMGEEIHRREHVERIVLEQKATITETKEELEIAESTIVSLREKLEELTARTGKEIKDLNKTITSKEKEHYKVVKVKDERIKTLETELTHERIVLQSSAHTIEGLEQDVLETSNRHAKLLEQRESRISDLYDQLKKAEKRIAQLEKQNASLEERVTEEAEQMLSMTAEKQDEIDELKAQLDNLKAQSIDQIEALQAELERKGAENANVVEEGEEMIEDLEITVTRMKRVEEVLKMRLRSEAAEAAQKLLEMYNRLVAQEQETRRRLEEMRTALLEDVDAGLENAKGEMEKGIADASALMGEYRSESAKRVEEATTEVYWDAEAEVKTVVVTKKVGKKVVKKARKSARKFADSGIGVSSDHAELEGEMVDA